MRNSIAKKDGYRVVLTNEVIPEKENILDEAKFKISKNDEKFLKKILNSCKLDFGIF